MTRSEYPTEFVAALTEGGFLGGADPARNTAARACRSAPAAAILEEINVAGCTATQCHAQMYIMGTLLRHGNEEQKQRYLPGIARGELRLQAFGVTEPTTGSDTTQLKTRAVKKGNDRYVVNGQKVWTTRALHSDLMLLLARTTPVDEVKKRSEGLSVFLVDIREAKGKGMEIRPINAMINHNTTRGLLRQSGSAGREPDRRGGQGLRYIMDGMNAERILVASEAVGDGRWFLKKASTTPMSAWCSAAPIGKNQGVQFPHRARLCGARGRRHDVPPRGRAVRRRTRRAARTPTWRKLLASEACWQAAEAAMQTYGGFSYAQEYDIERKWREARLYQIAPISTNMVLAYLGQHVLGMPRSY